ncbi:BTB/POZ domain-containing adapter for CUL3-mediated RhoA degradation protein 3 [Anolis carolinensis]|uniref:BTB/POZ domain-containing adapter for CUL3-mediated RhoA degradation protein 3 n=1 Tax=Anolis carolinensis TaxID=28377 RepID=UPI002F2B79A5
MLLLTCAGRGVAEGRPRLHFLALLLESTVSGRPRPLLRACVTRPLSLSSEKQEAVAAAFLMEAMSGEAVLPGAVTRMLPPSSSSSAPPCSKAPPPACRYVKLNVGGALSYTTTQTLTKQDTMLKAMFSGRMEVLTDSEGWILIDRCGKHFGTILNYLRDGAVPLPDSRRDIEELLAEAKYYLVQGLVDECQAALQNKDVYEPFCKVPIITSSKEEQKLIATSNKPAVKLLYNRSNNKYSYTSNSDDNMLKNIELFDKLSLRFNGRVLFIKDVIGDEICCWSFYGQGRKIAEVCCTSIVYATEKKQTKVEFPEARIYEETLNILLYEAQDGRGPDNALLEATGGAAGRSHHLDEDEERERERIERVRRIHIKRPDDRTHHHQ